MKEAGVNDVWANKSNFNGRGGVIITNRFGDYRVCCIWNLVY